MPAKTMTIDKITINKYMIYESKPITRYGSFYNYHNKT